MIENKLKELNIELPKAPDPVGAYVAYKKINNLLYISGQLPIDQNGKMTKGTVGNDLTLEEAQEASKLCVMNILAQARKSVSGDLNKIKSCVKITGYVNSTNLVGKAQLTFFSNEKKNGSMLKFWKWNQILRTERFFKKIK